MEMKFITSYEFRNDTMFLRNEFKSVGMFKLPLVKRQEISLEDVNLIGYDKLIIIHGKILVLAVRGETYGVIVGKHLCFALIT